MLYWEGVWIYINQGIKKHFFLINTGYLNAFDKGRQIHVELIYQRLVPVSSTFNI